MASTWGDSWGVAWGISWEIAAPAPAVVVGGKSKWQKGMEEYHKRNPQPKYHDDVVKRAAAHMSSLGGLARAKSLTASQRSAIAVKAAQVRWK